MESWYGSIKKDKRYIKVGFNGVEVSNDDIAAIDHINKELVFGEEVVSGRADGVDEEDLSQDDNSVVDVHIA